MEDQKATKPQVKFDTMKAFAGMGAAVEVLMKAVPNAFTHATVSGKEQQGICRSRGRVHARRSLRWRLPKPGLRTENPLKS